MKFGDRLRELLELNELSQKQLGEKLNIAPSTIGNYVRNIREPDHATLKVFANYFNVSVDFLPGNTVENELNDEEQLLLTVYKGLNCSYKKFLLRRLSCFLNCKENKRYKKLKRLCLIQSLLLYFI